MSLVRLQQHLAVAAVLLAVIQMFAFTGQMIRGKLMTWGLLISSTGMKRAFRNPGGIVGQRARQAASCTGQQPG